MRALCCDAWSGVGEMVKPPRGGRWVVMVLLGSCLRAFAQEGFLPDKSCVADEAAFQDLEQRDKKLKELSVQLEKQKSELDAREKIIQERLMGLEDLRKEIVKIKEEENQALTERIDRLVKTFETMSPKKAADLLIKLDDQLAVATLLKMDTGRLAKIMNVMDPKKSSRLSAMLTQDARKRGQKP